MRATCLHKCLRLTDQRRWEIHRYSQSAVAESQNGWGWKWLHGVQLLKAPAQERLSGSICPGLFPDSPTWIPSGPLLPSCSLDGCAPSTQRCCLGLFLCSSCWISHLQKLERFLISVSTRWYLISLFKRIIIFSVN